MTSGDVVDERADGVGIGNVELRLLGSAAEGSDCASSLVGRLGVDFGKHDPASSLRKSLSERSANARGSAGYDRHRTIERSRSRSHVGQIACSCE